MMAYLIADLGYALALACNLVALFLALEWLAHLIPGAWLNPVRRMLFLVSLPFLKFSDRFFTIKSGSFNARGLLTAFLLMLVARYGTPLLVLLSFSMRG
jgi:hypothetical protein